MYNDTYRIVIPVSQYISYRTMPVSWHPYQLLQYQYNWLFDIGSCQLIMAWWHHMTSNILVNIGSDNGLSPVRCQAIIWINAD